MIKQIAREYKNRRGLLQSASLLTIKKIKKITKLWILVVIIQSCISEHLSTQPFLFVHKVLIRFKLSRQNFGNLFFLHLSFFVNFTSTYEFLMFALNLIKCPYKRNGNHPFTVSTDDLKIVWKWNKMYISFLLLFVFGGGGFSFYNCESSV